MTLEELRKELAEGHNECVEESGNSNLRETTRAFYAGKAEALMFTLGRINLIMSEKVSA